jgi:hypothetical protein
MGKKLEETRSVAKIAYICDDKTCCHIKEELSFSELCGRRAANKNM